MEFDKDLAFIRQADYFLRSNDILTAAHYNNIIIYCLAIHKNIKKVFLDIDFNNRTIGIRLKTKMFSFFIPKKSLKQRIIFGLKEYLPNYKVEVKFI